MINSSSTRVVTTRVTAGIEGLDVQTATEQYHQAQLQVCDARGRFYDRLALLSGGAIVLSISFLGSVATKGSVHLVAALFCSWFLLASSLLCCIFRNPPFHKYVIYSYAFYYAEAMLRSKRLQLATLRNEHSQILSQRHEDGMAEYKSDAEIEKDISSWHKRNRNLLHGALTFHRWYRLLEYASLGFFVSGLLALTGFAVANALSNSHQMFK